VDVFRPKPVWNYKKSETMYARKDDRQINFFVVFSMLREA